ncbi:MAG: ABC transporter permease [Acidobacteriota bacterium]|nr:ABC transporter permease [Acidobacteriota bacterium]
MGELRLAIRMLRKQPAFSSIAAITLALGIGATAAVFSLIQGVLLTPPPYRQPDRMVVIAAARTDGQKDGESRGWSSGQWLEWQRETRSFDAIAGYGWLFNFLILPQGSESLEGLAVTRDYFRVTGLQPLMGRPFSADEGRSGAPPVVILGYDMWRRNFNSDPKILGKTLRISRQKAPWVVIGVMPPGVRFLPDPQASQEPNYNVNATVDFWVPAAPDPAQAREPGWNVAGRLRPGVTIAAAQAELDVLVRREGAAEADYQGFSPRLQSLPDVMNRDGRRILYPLLGAAALVLLIACGNAAALLLVRGIQRQREFAVRTALGVARGALFRQVAAESLMLAALGGGAGTLLAAGVIRVFQTIGGHAIPRLDAVTIGWPVLAWGSGAALFAAIAAAIAPALRASGLNPASALKSAGPKVSAGRGERRLLRAVTIFQTALTLALLTGAGLLIRTMMNLAKAPAGYDTSHILTMTVTSMEGDWFAFHRQVLDRVSGIPGVRNAAFAWGVPLTGNSWPGDVEIEGQPPATKRSDRTALPLRSVTPGYFDLLGLSISHGRDFRSTDDKNAPGVAIVNQSFADRYFPRGDAVGKTIWGQGRNRPGMRIVGIVSNAREADITHSAAPEAYLPFWQAQAFSKDLVIRTAGDPAALGPAIQRAIRAVQPAAAIENVRTLEQIRGNSIASRSFAMQLLVGFAIIGCVLSLVGVYGVLSLSVASRRRELAIRSAVGASQRHIRMLVFREGFRLVGGGMATGIAAGLLLSRILRSFLYGVNDYDPLTFLAAGALFAIVSMAACWAPGSRAATVDPIEALRCD